MASRHSTSQPTPASRCRRSAAVFSALLPFYASPCSAAFRWWRIALAPGFVEPLCRIASMPHARSPATHGFSLSLANTSTHATLQVRLYRVGLPAPTPVSSLYWCRLMANACSRGLTSQHFSGLRPTPASAAVAASPSSAPCCRSTPAPAQLLLGGGASRWRPGSWSRSAASPLCNPHARLTLARVLSLSQTRTQLPLSTRQPCRACSTHTS
jgi:hypothetical protein